MDLVPTPAGLGSQFLHWGIPILGGIGGFFLGDIWGAAGAIEPWIGPVLEAGNIPFGGRLGYRAFATAGIYAIVLAIVGGLMFKFLPAAKGGFMRAAAKTVSFYLGGTILRLVLAGFLPVQVGVGGPIALPAAVR